MKKLLLSLATVLVYSVLLYAQDDTYYRPYAPAGIPLDAPKWMEQLTDIENINYYAMCDSFAKLQRDNPFYRVKTPQNKGVINYFRRWQKTYEPYVQKDGSIKMPTFSNFRQFVSDMNAEAQSPKRSQMAVNELSSSRWKVVSPLMTYRHDNKVPFPGQANIKRFDVYKQDTRILYAGAETGMVFRSDDKGEHWTSVTPNFYFGGIIETLEISYNNPDKVVIGAGQFLWLTEDGGKNWTEITPSQFRTSGSPVRDVLFHPTNDNRIIMGNRKGIYESIDNGVTWNELTKGEVFDLKHKYTKGKIEGNELYALILPSSTEKMVLKYSNNEGKTWKTRTPNIQLASGRIGLSAAPNGDNYIYVLACKADNKWNLNHYPYYFGSQVLFKSTNAGQSWETIDLQTAGLSSAEFGWSGSQGYYTMLCGASSKDPNTVFVGLLQFYMSTDGGNKFTHIGGNDGGRDDNIHFDLQEIRCLSDECWISHDGGLNYSKDFFASKSEVRINGIYASEFHGFDQGWNEDVIAGGRYHNGDMAEIIGKYKGALHMGGGETYTGYVMLSDPHRVLYSDSYPSSFILPENMDGEVEKILSIYSTFPYEADETNAHMEFDPRYAKSFLLIKHGGDLNVLWKTVDDGQSFVVFKEFNERINTYAIARSNPNKIVVATSSQIYYTKDGGEEWKTYELPEELISAGFKRIAIHPTNENEIWVSDAHTAGVMYRTSDNGKEWQKIDEGLTITMSGFPHSNEATEKVKVTRFFLTGNDKNAAYALGVVERMIGNDVGQSTSRGRVFYRDNTTNAWVDYSEGLPPVITLKRMLPFYKDGKIRIATNNGVWERELVEPNFKPIAQPMILNVGKGDNTGQELQFDSYSIVNQNDVTWQWDFQPKPISISNAEARNPIVKVVPDQSYHVTLTVTTSQGLSDTKTIENMIVGTKPVEGAPDPEPEEPETPDVPEEPTIPDPDDPISSVTGLEVLPFDVVLSTNFCTRGELIRLQPRNITEDCQWKLFDMKGVLMDVQKIPTSGTTSIQTDKLASGIYVYVIYNKTFKKTGKIIIQ